MLTVVVEKQNGCVAGRFGWFFLLWTWTVFGGRQRWLHRRRKLPVRALEARRDSGFGFLWLRSLWFARVLHLVFLLLLLLLPSDRRQRSGDSLTDRVFVYAFKRRCGFRYCM